MKVYRCQCGSAQFYLINEEIMLVDWNREGPIEGHPRTTSESRRFSRFRCIECGREIIGEETRDMLRQVIKS